jgi:hypothetical protein
MTQGQRRSTYVWWQTVDFRPAPPGWRVVSLFGENFDVVSVEHMPGWLIQDQYVIDRDTDQVVADDSSGLPRSRRVVPGVSVEGHDWAVTPADDFVHPDPNTWLVLPPGVEVPGEEEVRAESARRVKRERLRAEGAVV